MPEGVPALGSLGKREPFVVIPRGTSLPGGRVPDPLELTAPAEGVVAAGAQGRDPEGGGSRPQSGLGGGGVGGGDAFLHTHKGTCIYLYWCLVVYLR